ncbi:Hypothetical predicted protein [Pelobates cultripes]|nr:Hypothetical predicted protein [Pelobates cultripes]
MTGETKHVYTINNKEPSSKDSHRDTAFEHFNKNDAVDNSMSRVSESSDSAFSSVADKGPEKNSREKEPHSQREAVIRPQQAGKIDFKSLQNRSKFHSDASEKPGKRQNSTDSVLPILGPILQLVLHTPNKRPQLQSMFPRVQSKPHLHQLYLTKHSSFKNSSWHKATATAKQYS